MFDRDRFSIYVALTLSFVLSFLTVFIWEIFNFPSYILNYLAWLLPILIVALYFLVNKIAEFFVKNPKILLKLIPFIIVVAMLLIAAFCEDLTYGYFQLLREFIVIFGVYCMWKSLISYDRFCLLFFALVVVFSLFKMPRDLWKIVDIVSAIIFALFAIKHLFLKKDEKNCLISTN